MDNIHEKINLINLQYGVSFAAIFNFMFSYKTTESITYLDFAIHSSNYVVFFALILYFIIDWLTANYLRNKITLSPFIILSWSIAIWYLGAVIILNNGIGAFKYLWLGLYIVMAGFYDLFGFSAEFNTKEELSTIIWIFISAIKVILGSVIVFPSAIYFFNNRLELNELNNLANLLVISVLLLKLARFGFMFSKLKDISNE